MVPLLFLIIHHLFHLCKLSLFSIMFYVMMLSSGITWQIIMLDFQSFTLIWLYKFFQHIWQKLEIISVVIFQNNDFLQFFSPFWLKLPLLLTYRMSCSQKGKCRGNRRLERTLLICSYISLKHYGTKTFLDYLLWLRPSFLLLFRFVLRIRLFQVSVLNWFLR